jgi:hypothetical protein
LSISAKEAPTLIRRGNPTPASLVMFLNLPPPKFFQSSLPPTAVHYVMHKRDAALLHFVGEVTGRR